MTNARIFLDLYNTLEELLKARYVSPDGRFSNVILRFTSENEGRKWREELDLCREIRNMLSHHSQFEGDDIFQPSDAIIEFLRRVVDSIENPPAAMTICTPVNKLFTCTDHDRAAHVIRRMHSAGYSHVPVVKNKTLTGVFSAGALFSRITKYGECKVDAEEILLADFGEFLPVDAHETETYRFVSPRASYYKLKNMFDPGGPGKRRVAAVFVTRTGKSDSELLGMITPWDMLRCFPE